jgi:hypothetical protein
VRFKDLTTVPMMITAPWDMSYHFGGNYCLLYHEDTVADLSKNFVNIRHIPEDKNLRNQLP